MTVKDQIRALPDLKPRDVAAQLGVRAQYVSYVRWIDKQPGAQRAYDKNYRRRHNPHYVPWEDRWDDKRQRKLEQMLAAGKSFTQIAEAMGVTKGKIAGRVFRMRRAQP